MTDPILQAQIDAAIAYEDFFVPALFQQWTSRLIAAAGLQPGQRVLDVACGTGVLARDAAARLGTPETVVGLDPNRGMLEVARRLAPEVEWCEGVAEALPFPEGSFDAVVSQFGLMFFTDRRQALGEMLRVLVPGGRMAVAVWDSLDNSPAYAVEVALLERIAGERAADALRAPFVLGDKNELAALFAGAGVADVAITTYPGTAVFPSIRSMVEADLRGWLPVMDVFLPDDEIDRILDEARYSLSPYLKPNGKVMFDSPAHIVTGIRR